MAAVKDGSNLMPVVIEAIENHCTLGEISDVLRAEFGEYRQ
jgi:methylmalonyl-CoA mutase N-terminal domain/subunit